MDFQQLWKPQNSIKSCRPSFIDKNLQSNKLHKLLSKNRNSKFRANPKNISMVLKHLSNKANNFIVKKKQNDAIYFWDVQCLCWIIRGYWNFVIPSSWSILKKSMKILKCCNFQFATHTPPQKSININLIQQSHKISLEPEKPSTLVARIKRPFNRKKQKKFLF